MSYAFPDSELLSQFAGDFKHIHTEVEPSLMDTIMKFEIEDNQLQWHYVNKDVNSDHEGNIPLFWHKKNIFFNNQAGGIWEFNKTNQGNITFKLRGVGTENRFIKK